jgi:hypothetical protein
MWRPFDREGGRLVATRRRQMWLQLKHLNTSHRPALVSALTSVTAQMLTAVQLHVFQRIAYCIRDNAKHGTEILSNAIFAPNVDPPLLRPLPLVCLVPTSLRRSRGSEVVVAVVAPDVPKRKMMMAGVKKRRNVAVGQR